jgi:hypothetical protein
MAVSQGSRVDAQHTSQYEGAVEEGGVGTAWVQGVAGASKDMATMHERDGRIQAAHATSSQPATRSSCT